MMQIIHAMLVAEPRLYLDEIRTWSRLVDAKHGISHGSAHAAVKALGFTNQSIELIAAQRRAVNRSSFLATAEYQDIRRFYFIDETSKGKDDADMAIAVLAQAWIYISQGNQSGAENHFCQRLHTQLLLATTTRVL